MTREQTKRAALAHRGHHSTANHTELSNADERAWAAEEERLRLEDLGPDGTEAPEVLLERHRLRSSHLDPSFTCDRCREPVGRLGGAIWRQGQGVWCQTCIRERQREVSE